MTVAPACVASNSKPQLSNTEGSSVNLQSSQGSAVSYHNGRKCRVLPISELGSAYAPAELYCPPPDDRDTPDCFTLGRRKRTRAVAKRAANRKITETTTSQRKGSDTAVCVNPWDVEYQPNPVIFSHLASSVKAQPERNMEGSTIAAPSLTRSLTSGNHIATFPPNLNSFEDRPTLHVPFTTIGLGTLMKRQSIDAESSDDTIPTMESSISEFLEDDISPITASEGTSLFKGKGRCLDDLGTVEIINVAATMSSSSSNCDNTLPIVLSSDSYACTPSGVIAPSSRASTVSSPLNASSPANFLLSPSTSTETSSDSSYPCPVCHLSFRTSGLRRCAILTSRVIIRVMLIQGAAEFIRTVNITADTLANYASQDLPSKRTSNDTKITFTDMKPTLFPRSCSHAQTLTAQLRERRTPGKTTSNDTYSVVRRLPLQGI